MSDGEKKKIFINPNLFSIENASRKKKPKPDKAIRIKPVAKPVSDRTRKNQFLKRIRENQEKQYKSLFEGEKIKVDMPKKSSDKTTDEFQSDFDKSLTFMTAVADAKPTPSHTNHNHTFKNTSMRHQMDDFGIDQFAVDVAVDLPIDFLLPPPSGGSLSGSSYVPHSGSSYVPTHTPVSSTPTMSFPNAPEYGCLKNGNLPTKRSLHNTTMKKPHNPVVGSLKTQDERQQELELLRKLHQEKKDAEKPKPKIVQRKIKKLLRRTFNVGKDKYRPRVGVLLPNRTIRNNVTTKSFMIKQKPISEIRKFLIQQGFIKVGSTAPTDVLRKIYESVAMIDGDVKNHNPDNLLYNFFKGTEKH